MPRHASSSIGGALVFTDDEFARACAADVVPHGVSLVVPADNGSGPEQFWYFDPDGGTPSPTPIAASQVDQCLKIAPKRSGPGTVVDAQVVPPEVQDTVLTIAALLACPSNAQTTRLLGQHQAALQRCVRRWKKPLHDGAMANLLLDATHVMWTLDPTTRVWSADAVDALFSPTMRALLKNHQLRLEHGRAYAWPDADAYAALCPGDYQQVRFYGELLPRQLLAKLELATSPQSADNNNDDALWRYCKDELLRRIAKCRRLTAPPRKEAGNALFGTPQRAPACMLRAAALLKNPHRMTLATIFKKIHNALPPYYSEHEYYALLLLNHAQSKVSVKSFSELQQLIKRTIKHHRNFNEPTCESIQRFAGGSKGLSCPHSSTRDCAKAMQLKTAGRTPSEFAMLSKKTTNA